MTEPVEVTIDAPGNVVWRAFTDTDEIKRWFGWDYDGLEAEVRYIFFDHATQHAPDRIELEDETGSQTIRLLSDGSRTVVAVDGPDELAEGWRTFFCQLGYYLEHHHGEQRRTIHLSGEASPSAVVELLDGEARRASRFVALADGPDGLVAVESSGELESGEPAQVKLTVSTYGRDEDELARIRERWQDRWRSVASG